MQITAPTASFRLRRSNPARLVRPASRDELTRIVENGGPIIAAGSRHAMGGQPFCAGGTVLDLRGLKRVLARDPHTGVVEFEAGYEWPELHAFLRATPWSIVQKQTGADRLTLCGASGAGRRRPGGSTARLPG
jgi:FAD/FMN-containing dehydrogenase